MMDFLIAVMLKPRLKASIDKLFFLEVFVVGVHTVEGVDPLTASHTLARVFAQYVDSVGFCIEDDAAEFSTGYWTRRIGDPV